MAIRSANKILRLTAGLAGTLGLALFATTSVLAQEPSPPQQPATQNSAVPDSSTSLRLKENVANSYLLYQVSPLYPLIAKNAHISGTVVLDCIISTDGTVESLDYISGPPLLLKAAMDAVRQWRYKPVLVNGKPVRIISTVSVIFTLAGSPSAPKLQESRPDPIGKYNASGYVNDFAAIITAQVQTQLEQICKDLYQKTKTQMTFVTVVSLEGLSGKEFATRLGNRWGVGDKDTNRGVLVLLSKTDRQYRIAVGLGLESVITDAEAARLGQEMLPALKQEDYGAAFLHLAEELRDEIQEKLK
jgi:TonB family protein